MAQSRIEAFFDMVLEDEIEKKIISMITRDLENEEMVRILLGDDKGVKK